MCSLKYDTKEPTYNTETDSQTEKRFVVDKVRGMVGSLGLADASY